MFYLIWIISAFVAVGLGLFAATKIEKREQ